MGSYNSSLCSQHILTVQIKMADLTYTALDYLIILSGYDSYCSYLTKARGKQQVLWLGCEFKFFHLMHLPKFIFFTDPALKQDQFHM